MSFKDVKRTVVPNQSMSLREIVRRFVRRESLPLSQDGVYEERFGDLEKLAKADITVQFERVAEIKDQIAGFVSRTKAKADADALAAAVPPVVPPPVVSSPPAV